MSGVFPDTPAEEAGINDGRRDHRGRRQVDRRASPRMSRPLEIRGPDRDRASTLTDRAGRRRQARDADARARRRPRFRRSTARSRATRTATRSATSRFAHLQRGRPRRAARRDRATSIAAARRASCSTCAATAAACSTRPCSARASSSKDGNVVSTRSRTQGDQDYAAVGDRDRPAPDGRPRQSRHRLGGGDPHRGAAAERPRDGGRHPHLRQGRLPGGHAPARGRRARPDDRPVPDRGRHLDPRRGRQARRAGRRRPEHRPRSTRASTARSRSSGDEIAGESP